MKIGVVVFGVLFASISHAQDSLGGNGQTRSKADARSIDAKLRLQFDFGRTTLYNVEVQAQEEPLTSGFELQAAMGFFVTPSLAIGAVFNHFGKENSYKVYAPTGEFATVSDDISLNFFGPALMVRSQNESKAAALTAMVAGGYIGFVDDGTAGNIDARLTGNTFGLLCAIGGEVNLNTVFSVGLELRNIIGTISSRKLEVGSQSGIVSEDFDVSRFTFGGGFRLNL